MMIDEAVDYSSRQEILKDFLSRLKVANIDVLAVNWGQNELGRARVLVSALESSDNRINSISLIADYRAEIRREILAELQSLL